jgi:hypothetical protein
MLRQCKHFSAIPMPKNLLLPVFRARSRNQDCRQTKKSSQHFSESFEICRMEMVVKDNQVQVFEIKKPVFLNPNVLLNLCKLRH